MDRRSLLATGVASMAAMTVPFAARAYPDRNIRLVVPFSPGGATDVVGRMWAERMKPLLGTVVTENRGGGGGVTGAAEVARAAAGRPHLPVRQYQHAGADPGDHDPARPTIRSRISSASTSLQFADLDRGARVGAGAHARGARSPTPRPTRASCRTARPAPARLTNLAGELFKQLIGAPDIVHIPVQGRGARRRRSRQRSHPDDDAESSAARCSTSIAPARCASWR